jgi:DNA repair protein RadC
LALFLLFKGGTVKMSQIELKAYLRQIIVSPKAEELADKITNHYHSARELMFVDEEELLKIKGMNSRNASRVLAGIKLGAEVLTAAKMSERLSSPMAVFELCRDMALLDREHFVIIALDVKNKVVGRECVSIGSLNSTLVHPREVFKFAIKCSAHGIICVHNHPSGDPAPSDDDCHTTSRLEDAGKLLGINVIDHLIIGADSYYSYKESGAMN